jgi:uncharacterized membrane protein
LTDHASLPPQTPVNSSGPSPQDPNDEKFYASAYSRMTRCMLVALIVAAPLLFWRWGWRLTGGFLLGGFLALLNFRWLERTVYGISEIILQNPDRPPSGRVVRRFLLRYALIAIGAYVILKSLDTAVYGFFAGLTLSVIGVFCEAVYELFTTVRSKT